MELPPLIIGNAIIKYTENSLDYEGWLVELLIETMARRVPEKVQEDLKKTAYITFHSSISDLIEYFNKFSR